MKVNLINNGLTEENSTLAICNLQNNIIINDNNLFELGNFNCLITDYDKSIEYSSFKYNTSSFITGIPENEILLDPVLTDSLINNRKLCNYTKNNCVTEKFNSSSIDTSECGNSGKFTIKGKLITNIENSLNFELSITYPFNSIANCLIEKGSEGEDSNIECTISENINNEQIIIPQNSIFDNDRELIISKIETNGKVTCSNGKVVSSKNKIANGKVLFRQVNNFKSSSNKATFFFAGICFGNLNKGDTVNMQVFVTENNNKIKREATCTLREDVNSNDGVQGDFDCEVNIENTASDLEIISSEQILGLGDWDDDYQKSPKLTDDIISSTRNKVGIAKLLDFSDENNKNILPPKLSINSMYTNSCSKKGTITIEGTFDNEIIEEFEFEVPLSYPLSTLKCVAPITSQNRRILINCKIKKEFEGNEIIIERRMIKKKYKEMILIPNYELNLNSKLTCGEYNKIKLENYKQKLNSPYTFLQMSSFVPARKLTMKLFTISTKKHYRSEKIFISLIIKIQISRLRRLDIDEKETEAACISDKDYDENSIIEMNCESTDEDSSYEKAEGVTFDSQNMTGIPEFYDPAVTDQNIQNGLDVDFSTILNEKIPQFNGEISDEENCENGQFSIKGTADENINKTDNVNINFTSPDSSGLCNIEGGDKGKSFEIICQNKDYFDESIIIIEKQLIRKDKNILFLMNNLTSPSAFSCIISDNTLLNLLPDNRGNDTNPGTSDPTDVIRNSGKYNHIFSKNNGSGLSGGAIAAIIIVCVVAFISVIIIISLIKKGILGSKNKYGNTELGNESSSNANVYDYNV